MAKEKAEAKEKEAPEHKYGVTDLADALDIEGASVRVKLRAAGIKKEGRSYGWDTKEELQKVIDKLKAKSKSKADEEDEDDEKPAKKKKAKA